MTKSKTSYLVPDVTFIIMYFGGSRARNYCVSTPVSDVGEIPLEVDLARFPSLWL